MAQCPAPTSLPPLHNLPISSQDSHITPCVAQTVLGIAFQIHGSYHQPRCLPHGTVIIAPIKLSGHTAGRPRGHVSGQTVRERTMELRLTQWAAGTRCVCKHDGERIVRGNGQQWSLLGPSEAVSMTGRGLALDRPFYT